MNIGAYAIYVDKSNVTADGNKISMLYKPGSGSWYASGAGEIKNDSSYIYAAEASGATDATIVSAQTFVWPLKITNTLNISDDTSLTGSATITVMYL